MKTIIRIVSVCIVIILLTVNAVDNISALENISEEKYKCLATIDDNFADDRIMVMFTQERSLEFQNYMPIDFSEIQCYSVRNMTSAISTRAKEAIETALCTITSGDTPIIDDELDLSMFKDIVCLELTEPGKENVLAAIEIMQKREDVLYACPDYRYEIMLESVASTTDDSTPYYVPWDNIVELLGLSDAWELRDEHVSISDPINIAVIDSGISHGNFRLEMDWDNSRYFVNGSADDDISSDSYQLAMKTDTQGHGTHVAGIIRSTLFPEAEYNSEFFYNGLYRYLSINVVDEDGGTLLSDLLDAFNYMYRLTIPINSSVEIIPPIINFSMGDAFNSDDPSDVLLFLQSIDTYPGLVVCSAGNDNLDSGEIYPAAWNIDNLITVSASSMSDVDLNFANVGRTSVDLFAPGDSIYSTYSTHVCTSTNCNKPNKHVSQGYHSLSGTSMAAPFVTGVAALLLSINPNLDAVELKEIILDSVDKVDALHGLCVTGGRLNAYTAIDTVLDNCNHSFTYTHSTDGHISTCSICGDTDTSRDAMYSVSQTASSITVKCSICSIQLPTCNHIRNCTPSNDYYHRVSCNICNFGLNIEHNLEYTNTTSGHIASCQDCNYSAVKDHSLHVVELDADDILHMECGLCQCTVLCDHGSYESEDSLTHTINCPECDILFTEEHTFLVQKITNSRHRVYCTGCSYTYTEIHDYYEASWEEFMEVGCTKCSLSIDCIHVEEYDYDDITHSIGCTSCGYEINQAHNYYRYVNTGSATSHTAYCWECGYAKSIAHTFVYTSVDNAIYHNANCRLCGYSGTKPHTWESNNGVSKCSLCGQRNSSPVTPVLSLPPEDEEELTE